MNYTTPFTVDSSGPNLYFTWFTDKRTNIYGWEIDYQIMGNCNSPAPSPLPLFS